MLVAAAVVVDWAVDAAAAVVAEVAAAAVDDWVVAASAVVAVDGIVAAAALVAAVAHPLDNNCYSGFDRTVLCKSNEH